MIGMELPRSPRNLAFVAATNWLHSGIGIRSSFRIVFSAIAFVNKSFIFGTVSLMSARISALVGAPDREPEPSEYGIYGTTFE